MTKKQYMELIKSIQNSVKKRRANTKHLTQKTIDMVIQCTKNDDFSAMKNTNLYLYNGGCYCELLEVITDYKKPLMSL